MNSINGITSANFDYDCSKRRSVINFDFASESLSKKSLKNNWKLYISFIELHGAGAIRSPPKHSPSNVGKVAASRCALDPVKERIGFFTHNGCDESPQIMEQILNSMILPIYPGKIPQTSPFTPKKKEFLHKLLVKHPGSPPSRGPCGSEILD